MHSEVAPPEPPRLDDESSFPTLGGSTSTGTSESQKPPDSETARGDFQRFTISGGVSNMRLPGNNIASRSTHGDFADRVRTTQPSAPAQSRGTTQVGYGAGSFSGREPPRSSSGWTPRHVFQLCMPPTGGCSGTTCGSEIFASSRPRRRIYPETRLWPKI